MKVMHLLQSNRFSGAENVVCQIISLFQSDDNIEMTYVCPDGPIRTELEKRNISHVLMPSFSQKEIVKVAKTLKPDYIHAHDFNASIRASMIHGPKIIAHLHSNPLWLSKLCPQSIVFTLRAYKFKRVIGVSSSILDEFIFHGLIEKKYTIIHNVIDVNRLALLAKEEMIQGFDLLFVGRLSEAKDPLYFLNIIKALHKRDPSLKAVMIGVGPLEEDCRSFINDNDLSQHVTMLGFQRNPYKYMNAAKIIVVTSKYEGFGLVAVEAMSLRKLVIARPVGALKDILDDDCGITCSSQEEFCDSILEYIGNSNQREILGKSAYVRALEYADINGFKEKIRNAYI